MAASLTGWSRRKWNLHGFSSWKVYLLALGLAVLWLPLYNLLFVPGSTPMIMVFLVPVLIGAYFGGLGPGLLATAIVAFVTNYYLIGEPHRLGLGRPIDVARWLALILIGTAISLITESLHRARRRAEAGMRLNAVTLSSIGDAVITTDKEGRVTFLNAEAERLTGWNSAEAIGQKLSLIFLIFNEVTRQPVEDPVQKVLASGKVVGLANHTVLRRRDGSETPIDDSGAPIKDDHGRIVGVVLVFRDCAAQKKAEAAVRESEAQYHSLVDQMPAGVFRKDAQGRYVFVNAFFCDLKDRTPEHFLGKTAAELGKLENPDLAELGTSHHEEIMRTGSTIVVDEEYVRQNGEQLHFHVVKTPVYDSARNVVGSQGILLDVTTRKAMESALAQSQSLYHSLVDQLPAGVFRKDAAGRYVFVNSFFCQLRQTTPDQFLGKFPAELPASENAFKAQATGHHEQIMRTGKTIEVLDEYHHPDGRTLFFHVVKTPVYDATGTIIGSQGILFDITERKRTEDTLREVMANTRCIINVGTVEAPEGWREQAPPDGSFFKWKFPVQNEAAAQTMLPLETKPGETYQQAWVRSRHPLDDVQMNRNSGQALLNNAPFYQNEFRCTDRNGLEHWMQQVVTLEKITENRWRLFGITTDVTDLKQAEQRYRRERALLRALIDSIPDLIFFKDQNSVFLGGNKAFENYSGRNATEIIGKTDWDLAPREIASGYRKVDQEVLEHQQPVLVEEWIPLRSGGGGTFETLKTPYLGPDGEVLGLIGISRDITGRRRTEDALRKLSRAVEQSSVAIVITDTRGNIEYVNPKFTQITGYPLAEAVGRNPRILKSGETSPEEYARLWETISTGGEWRGEFHNRKKNGDLYWESAFVSPIFDATGKITHYLGIKEDNTDRKRLEDQLRQSQKMEAIGQLAGGIAHDFNNLLTAIQGNASLLLDMDISTDEKTECAHEIVEAADRAANLTRQLLLFSRKQVIQPVNLNLNETVARMTKMLQRILGEDISLESKFAPGLPGIFADASMIEQVLLNLAVNSRDAMPEGGHLTISTTIVLAGQLPVPPAPAATEYVCLTITDTGCGIAPENLPRIFDPFFTTKEVGKGTGLGLATVYGIIQQHHGSIDVTSELQQGTTFKIYLPAANGPQAEKKLALPLSQLPRGTETILVVEDEAPVRQIVVNLLQRLGYTVLPAPHGKAALEIWPQDRARIDLLLTDVVMPEGINGYTLGQQLLADKPALKVIYTSGYTGSLESRPELFHEGTNFIHKPFTPEALAKIIRKNLDHPTPPSAGGAAPQSSSPAG